MKKHTLPGDIVFEPFSGSGSQLIAAERTGRRCRAIEVSPPFVDVAILRWQKATGFEASPDPPGGLLAQQTQNREPVPGCRFWGMGPQTRTLGGRHASGDGGHRHPEHHPALAALPLPGRRLEAVWGRGRGFRYGQVVTSLKF